MTCKFCEDEMIADHIMREVSAGPYETKIVCSCGWESTPVNFMGDNYASRSLERKKNGHLENVRKSKGLINNG